ncbi:hypothetical protein ACJ72_08361 [Emergomyces africanus]|uniref:non-specific serine/threonine protein kinase n=1 Tax=Emergomyces africanus TaxID=1955775 RepID=A0A1B7NKJ5_9EURO|nr:hypothetical protein ACJ72_08361 [Emergomyces africanus]
MSSQRLLEPQIFPSTGFNLIDHLILIEEETIPNYKPYQFYPVQIGQIFRERYQVVGKIGYSVSFTVWLSRDLVQIMLIISVRMLLDFFKITKPNDEHICLIHQSLGMSLYELKLCACEKVFAKDAL